MIRYPIKRIWFDMCISGVKGEEYREIKPYWEARYRNELGDEAMDNIMNNHAKSTAFEGLYHVGYSKNAPFFVTKQTLHVGKGKEEWGAEKGKLYFVATFLGKKKVVCSARKVGRKKCESCRWLIQKDCGFDCNRETCKFEHAEP